MTTAVDRGSIPRISTIGCCHTLLSSSAIKAARPGGLVLSLLNKGRIRLSTTSPENVSTAIPSAVLVSGAAGIRLGERRPKPTTMTPGQTEADVTSWAADGLETGVWEAGPGEFTATRVGYHEVCQILSGRATITEENGTVLELAAGDLFVTPAGWRGTWLVHETLRKVFVIQTLPTAE